MMVYDCHFLKLKLNQIEKTGLLKAFFLKKDNHQPKISENSLRSLTNRKKSIKYNKTVQKIVFQKTKSLQFAIWTLRVSGFWI